MSTIDNVNYRQFKPSIDDYSIDEMHSDVLTYILAMKNDNFESLFSTFDSSTHWRTRSLSCIFWHTFINLISQIQYDSLILITAKRRKYEILEILWKEKFLGKIVDRSVIINAFKDALEDNNIKIQKTISSLNIQWPCDVKYSPIHYMEGCRIENNISKYIRQKDWENLNKYILMLYRYPFINTTVVYKLIILCLAKICTSVCDINNVYKILYKTELSELKRDDVLFGYALEEGNYSLIKDLAKVLNIRWEYHMVSGLSSKNSQVVLYTLNNIEIESFSILTPQHFDIFDIKELAIRHKPFREQYLYNYPYDISRILLLSSPFMCINESLAFLEYISQINENIFDHHGVQHNGLYKSTKICKKMIQAAYNAGNDYIKYKLEEWLEYKFKQIHPL